MGSTENLSPTAIADEVAQWVEAAQAVLSARDQIAKAAETQLQALLQRTATVRRDDRLLWQVTPLRGDDSARIQAIARGASLRPLEPDVHRALTRLATDVGVAVDDFRKVRGFGRLLAFGKRRQRANQAAQFLADYHHWFLASGVRSALEAAMPADDPRISSLSVVDALADWVGLSNTSHNRVAVRRSSTRDRWRRCRTPGRRSVASSRVVYESDLISGTGVS